MCIFSQDGHCTKTSTKQTTSELSRPKSQRLVKRLEPVSQWQDKEENSYTQGILQTDNHGRLCNDLPLRRDPCLWVLGGA